MIYLRGILLLFLCIQEVYSQDKVFVVKEGERPESSIPFNFRFLNGYFAKGHLEFFNGKRTGISAFNYDLLEKQILFIGEKNDTLAIADDSNVKYLIIENHRFYHDPNRGYFEILSEDSLYYLTCSTKLISRKSTKATDEGYGGTTNGTSASVNLKNPQIIFTRLINFFIINRNGELTTANKKGFLKTFPVREDFISKYIKDERIDFNKENEVIKLFKFCVSN